MLLIQTASRWGNLYRFRHMIDGRLVSKDAFEHAYQEAGCTSETGHTETTSYGFRTCWGRDMTTWEVEHTDTYGGEANYGWVRRATFTMWADASETAVVRRAKLEIGESGMRHTKEVYNGDTIQLDYPGRCVRTFIVAKTA